MQNYVKTQSAHGKIVRAISNLKRTEALLGGLPVKFRKDSKEETIREILRELAKLQNKVKELET
jgi:hypothetical protein